MSVMTIRLPDAQHERLKAMARFQGVSVDELMEELATRALADFDVETRFQTRAARGSTMEGMALLNRIDAAN